MITIIGALLFCIPIMLYTLLAFGFPFGELALGGKYKVMPLKLRMVCAILIPVQLFAVMIILQTGGIMPLLFSIKVTKMICLFFAAYLSLNTVMCVFSKSKKEKYVSGTLAALSAVCCWILAFS
ncbi:MAG: hypothetical protein ACOZCL_03780 [Bacillota bacterium]